jgi:hypothetical protein
MEKILQEFLLEKLKQSTPNCLEKSSKPICYLQFFISFLVSEGKLFVCA